jgi:hypothetical protein
LLLWLVLVLLLIAGWTMVRYAHPWAWALRSMGL